MPKHEASGSLAIGAGDANDMKFFRGPAIFGPRYDRLQIVIGKDGGVIKRQFLESGFETHWRCLKESIGRLLAAFNAG